MNTAGGITYLANKMRRVDVEAVAQVEVNLIEGHGRLLRHWTQGFAPGNGEGYARRVVALGPLDTLFTRGS